MKYLVDFKHEEENKCIKAEFGDFDAAEHMFKAKTKLALEDLGNFTLTLTKLNEDGSWGVNLYRFEKYFK